ncbi:Ig-like domain-containing protein [Brochothrix campestris]|uniref:Ig-like domain-containing protein n=1 Tax=Brochothrix campestris FSL F6-1037 TaxID=1265861 RepID=W7C4E4_9LIST|nr:Ig-like domain-containing protein [Brochothrix campestris]EUJ34274.1 hypothetical protein BCAMP_12411 [Brochothrix campestris FSL F6-1037]
MTDTFKIYKGDDVIAEGESPLAITDVNPNTEVAEGSYKATRVVNDKESEKVDIPAFKTLAINPTAVALDKTTVAGKVGETVTLVATVSPSDATDKTVAWTSSAVAVATVDANGKVTYVAEGEAVITVKTVSGNKTATCTATITAE